MCVCVCVCVFVCVGARAHAYSMCLIGASSQPQKSAEIVQPLIERSSFSNSAYK